MVKSLSKMRIFFSVAVKTWKYKETGNKVSMDDLATFLDVSLFFFIFLSYFLGFFFFGSLGGEVPHPTPPRNTNIFLPTNLH